MTVVHLIRGINIFALIIYGGLCVYICMSIYVCAELQLLLLAAGKSRGDCMSLLYGSKHVFWGEAFSAVELWGMVLTINAHG